MTDFWSMTIQRLHGVSSDWKWCTLDAHKMPEDFVKVTGAVPCGTVKRGARKGSDKWPKEKQTFWARMSDLRETMAMYEQTTGKCCQCDGRGEVLVKMPHGKDCRECDRCNGKGVPKESADSARSR